MFARIGSENIASRILVCFLLMLIVSHYSTISNAQYHFVLLLIILIDHRRIHRLIKMVADPRLDYVALRHIHKAQDLNEGNHPPVIYSGSIERVDFGESKEDKSFVVAEVNKGQTDVEWRKLSGIRPIITASFRSVLSKISISNYIFSTDLP